ncbi:hypothetical protein CSUI_011199, partial [Cystoisospora suis]
MSETGTVTAADGAAFRRRFALNGGGGFDGGPPTRSGALPSEAPSESFLLAVFGPQTAIEARGELEEVERKESSGTTSGRIEAGTGSVSKEGASATGTVAEAEATPNSRETGPGSRNPSRPAGDSSVGASGGDGGVSTTESQALPVFGP